MYTPRSLRAVPPPGGLAVREEWLDPQVLGLEARGTLGSSSLGDLATRIAAGAAAGARWVVVDLAWVTAVDDDVPGALLAQARDVRARRGELVIAGATPDVAARMAAAGLPVLRSSADVAVLLRATPAAGEPRGREPIEALVLPRLDPA